MSALETSSIILSLLEVGQSPNNIFVNVTKCEETVSAVLLCPFPTHSHINLPFIYGSHDGNPIPWKLVLKRYFRSEKLSVLDIRSPIQSELNQTEREKGNGVRLPYFMFKPKLIFLSALPYSPAVFVRAVNARIYSKSGNYFFFFSPCRLFFVLTVHQPRLVGTISPSKWGNGSSDGSIRCNDDGSRTKHVCDICHELRGSFNQEEVTK